MIILEFLEWYYQSFKTCLKAWGNFVVFAFNLFSVPLLLKTLFAPWRRMEIIEQAPGFALDKFFQKLTFNLISRVIGFLVRLMIIFWGLIFALFFFILGFLIALVWPLLLPLNFLVFLFTRERKLTPEQLIAGKAKRFILTRLGLNNVEQLKNIPPEDVQAVLQWYLNRQELNQKKRRFWEKENLFRFPAFGTELAFGYTLELDKYVTDLSFAPSFSHQLVGREKEIKQIEAVLGRRAESNILLVGEPGSGKHTILLGLAKAIKEKRVVASLFYKRVMLLNMNLILGSSGLTPQAKAKFEQLLREAEKAGNIILVIDQIEKYASSQAGLDLTSIIAQIANSSRLQIIGVTTPQSFEQYIFPNTQFLKYFEKVEVVPPSKNEALYILETILPDFEKGKKVITTYQALKEIIDESDKLITNIPFPEKAIDLLDQLTDEAVNSRKHVINKEEVDNLISLKVKVPVGSLSASEAEKLKKLGGLLHRRIIGQDQAVIDLTKAMQRSRIGLSSSDKPIGTFLFLGPTGVGKTETAKALAESYFGNENSMVRFDMAQGLNLDLLYQECREHPFGVLLLDEFEKAKPEILNLFLTIFDEGYIKDSHGTLVSFKNMIIICTSNAGAEFIREKLSQPEIPFDKFQAQVTEYILQKGIFSPELLNRFDAVVIYKPLAEPEIIKVAQLQIAKLTERLQLKGIALMVEQTVYPILAQEGHSFEFGCRPLKRLIADQIESLIAQKILDNQIKKGETVKLTVDQESKQFRIEPWQKSSTPNINTSI